jgi:hypothetical protein
MDRYKVSRTFLCWLVMDLQRFRSLFYASPLPERIANQKFAVQSLVVLYRYSVDDHGRSGEAIPDNDKAENLVSRRILKKALHGVKAVASSTTNIFGDVASEIMGRYAKFLL